VIELRKFRLIKKAREEGRKIYYQYETWVNDGHVPVKEWVDIEIERDPAQALEPSSGLTTGIKRPIGKGKRLILSHVGGEDGFVPNAIDLLSATKNGDHHNNMNSERFEKHMKENVFPNLPEGAILVLDNASYHRRRLHKNLTKSSKKSELIEWLGSKNIDFDPAMTKNELYDKYCKNQNRNNDLPKNHIEKIADAFGCQIIYLPPYHCELNPIELIWAQIKNNVASKNGSYNLKHVEELTRKEIEKSRLKIGRMLLSM